MEKRENRDSPVYVWVKKRNHMWLKDEMKRLNYKSKSEFIDKIIDDLRNKKAPLDRRSY